MKHTGLLYSETMVRALMTGRKRETRRVIKCQPGYIGLTHSIPTFAWKGEAYWLEKLETALVAACPYGTIGDLLFCKESVMPESRAAGRVLYRAEYDQAEQLLKSRVLGPWKPPMLMKTVEARFWYRLTKIAVERVQAITEEGAHREGVRGRSIYRDLWNSLNATPKAVKGRVNGETVVTHRICFPWGIEGSLQSPSVTHGPLPIHHYPNPWVYVLGFEPTERP